MSAPTGLDMRALQAIAARRRGEKAYRDVLARIEKHLDAFDGFVAWSGGKDSTVVVDLARQVDSNVPVAFFDSGLLFPETVQYVERLVDEWRLNFQVIPAEPDLLTALVACGGFDHDAPDRLLGVELAELMITRPAAEAHRRHGPGNLWGVRAEESPGRQALYRRQLAAEARARRGDSREKVRAAAGGIVRRVDGTVTYGPIWDWQPSHVFEYLAGRGIEPNPLYDKLAKLGVPPGKIRVDSIINPAKLSNGHTGFLQVGWPDLFDRLALALPRLREWT
ncbi:phosphoadenosine phosphosulfate reductase family protein [Mycobacterium intracellulare]|uniref:phosphoadenosine phosphosulfate reductase family protein n=1 Tax=Mycobacterium intracellulare TaxID=1767 RepID=UPI001EEE52DF|nr:phosphoadenosine phosphosulfate reductase family protein [Mycobacterium intracellulare]MEE3755372.1 phosphoadenosine phosphosulfate reductase family protein [Mycobacterium intracellulare]